MKLIRCNNGHFYDQDKFGACPYCSDANSGAGSDMTEAFVQPPAGGQQKMGTNAGIPAGGVPLGGVSAGGMAIPNGVPAGGAPSPVNSSVRTAQSMISQSMDTALSPADATVPLSQAETVPVSVPTQGRIPTPAPAPAPTPVSLDSIGSSIMNANTMNEINSVFTPGGKDDDYTMAITPGGKTMGVEGLKPVVGWLICLSGQHIGRDFRLVQGKNYIGRDSSMDVCLDGEKTVSRDKHAVIVYEPKHHLYLIQSGDSKELTYVNDKVILESKELNAYDKVLVGDVKLLFIPLCDEKFNWTDELEGKPGKDEPDEE